jgi:hypothetical protein
VKQYVYFVKAGFLGKLSDEIHCEYDNLSFVINNGNIYKTELLHLKLNKNFNGMTFHLSRKLKEKLFFLTPRGISLCIEKIYIKIDKKHIKNEYHIILKYHNIAYTPMTAYLDEKISFAEMRKIYSVFNKYAKKEKYVIFKTRREAVKYCKNFKLKFIQNILLNTIKRIEI